MFIFYYVYQETFLVHEDFIALGIISLKDDESVRKGGADTD